MYPESKNHKDNHGCNICSDGVYQSSKKVLLVINGVSCEYIEHPPVFPQPKEVFMNGNIFYPAQFMEAVQTFYNWVVINHSAPSTLTMHNYTFTILLCDQTVIVPRLDGCPSKVLFKLFHLFKLALGEVVMLNNHEGEVYLQIDYLLEPPLEALYDAMVDRQGSSRSA